MASSSLKRPARRSSRALAGNSPSPKGLGFQAATCGHSGCGSECKVRYCGPTTLLRDHHAVHASLGVAHIWPAAIVSGLAIVLTGFIAYAGVHAEAPDPLVDAKALSIQMRSLNARLDRLEVMIDKVETEIDATRQKPVENAAATAPNEQK